MPSSSPVQAVRQVLEHMREIFSQHGFTVAEASDVDVDRGEYILHIENATAKGRFEIDEGGNGYIEIVHQPTGRHLLRQYSVDSAGAAAKNFADVLLQANADAVPNEPPIQIQFLDWILSSSKSSCVPRSPWVHSGSISHPMTQDFIKDPPPTITLTFSHYVSRQSILLTVSKDATAQIERQKVVGGSLHLIRKARIRSATDFAKFYEQAHSLAESSGPCTIHRSHPLRSRIKSAILKIMKSLRISLKD